MKTFELWYPCRGYDKNKEIIQQWKPVKPYQLNQGFGENANGFYAQLGMKGHNGLDLWAPDGTLLRAAHDGIVTFTGEDGSGGLGVVIRTDEKFDYNGSEAYFKTIYWHIKKGTFKVKAGQKVEAGDLIAEADNTGMSTGSHLHFGLKPVYQGENDWTWDNIEQNNGYFGAIDPLPYFNGHLAEEYPIMKQKIWILQELVRLYRLLFNK